VILRFVFRQAFLEDFDALGHVAHQAGNASPAEQQDDDGQHDQPMPDTLSPSMPGRVRSTIAKIGRRVAPCLQPLGARGGMPGPAILALQAGQDLFGDLQNK